MTEYPDFIESTKIGTAEGLLGVNCRHDFRFIDPEYSEPSYTAEQLAELERQEKKTKPYMVLNRRTGKREKKEFTQYEASQRMREMERQMRKIRKIIAGYKAGNYDGIFDDDIAAGRTNYHNMLKEYKQFAKSMGLQEQLQRVYADGLGRI